MAIRVLLLESSKLHGASLKTRLESIGAEVAVAPSRAELEAQLDSDFDLALADASLLGCEGHGHFELLKRPGKPVWLWSDDDSLLSNAALQIELGILKSFRKLNRADLIHDCSALLKKAGAASAQARSFLLVEDSATVRAYVRRILQDRFPASQVSEAEDGKSAISLMKSSKVDLIVTDLQMPGMDGSSFVQVLRNNPVLAKKPIVILSGMITAKVRDEMSSLPRLCLLAKPASPEALQEAVLRLLGGEKAAV
jgi:two-component system chemotaxis response regulator CheY